MQDKLYKNLYKLRTNITCYVLSIVLIGGLFAYYTPMDIFGYTEKTGIVQVDSTLNVRVGAGTTYEILKSGGSNVYLTPNYVVTIIGEATASNGAKWYNVRFVYTNGLTLEGYVHSDYVKVTESIDYQPDADFEKYMTDQGFPESYKASLRILHTKYPKWVFIADKINLEWNDVVNNEYVIGRSLISKNSISSWKSTDTKAYNWDTGTWYGFDGDSWVAASKELVAYALDPRNFLDEDYIFQFETLSYNKSYHTKEGLTSLVKGTFLATGSISNDASGNMSYIDAIMSAATASGASPFYLASSIIQEIGTAGASKSITGTETNYKNLYNYYNIGAYTTATATAIENGLIFASKTDAATDRPWNTRLKAIVGGAKYTANGYINIGQDTLYYKKFDFVGTCYTHQYMTHIIGARQEGLITSRGYSADSRNSLSITFKIPVFNNMPSTVSAIPTKDGGPNNCLKNISLSNGSITPTFDKFTTEYDAIVENNVGEITINATAIDTKATITGAGKQSLKVGQNKITISVKAENGDVRNYVITVVRKEGEITNSEEPTTKPEEPTTAKVVKVKPNGVKLDETSKLVTGVSTGIDASKLKEKFVVENATVKITDKDNKDKTGKVGTGDKVKVIDTNGKTVYEYTVVIYGDVNGDGEISGKDALLIRKHILNMSKLTGSYATSSDINGDGEISGKDALLVRKHILGMSSILQ